MSVLDRILRRQYQEAMRRTPPPFEPFTAQPKAVPKPEEQIIPESWFPSPKPMGAEMGRTRMPIRLAPERRPAPSVSEILAPYMEMLFRPTEEEERKKGRRAREGTIVGGAVTTPPEEFFDK